MRIRISPRYVALLCLLPALAFLVYLIRGNAYSLNRNVREVAFRVVQMETLSRTTRTDYRIRFDKAAFSIASWDADSETWQPYLNEGYRTGIECAAVDFDIVFSRGRFHEIRYREGQKKPPRYLIVEFYSLRTAQKKGIIFYRDEDWRVLN